MILSYDSVVWFCPFLLRTTTTTKKSTMTKKKLIKFYKQRYQWVKSECWCALKTSNWSKKLWWVFFLMLHILKITSFHSPFSFVSIVNELQVVIKCWQAEAEQCYSLAQNIRVLLSCLCRVVGFWRNTRLTSICKWFRRIKGGGAGGLPLYSSIRSWRWNFQIWSVCSCTCWNV